MAEEKQIGIPQEPLDYSSELATRPYELDADKKYEVQRHSVGSEALRRVVVGSDWKTTNASVPAQFFTGLGQGVENILAEAVPKSVVKWGTDPTGAATGLAVGTTGYSIGSRVAGKVVANALPKLLTGAVKLVGGVTGALGLASIVEPTPIGQEWAGKPESPVPEEYDPLKTAEFQLKEGVITQEDYDKRVAEIKAGKDKLDVYNAVVDELDGIAYPSENFGDAVVSGASRLLQSREELQAIRNAKKGIDPESVGYKAGNVLGNVAVFAGSAVLGNQIARYGTKGAVRRAFIDEETKEGAELLSSIKPIRSRKAAQEIAEDIVKGTTAEIESASYVWENARDYIEKTGDTTLSEFTPTDAKTLSAAAYGAIAGEIEVMGGVEALATGAFRKLGVLTAGKAIAKTVLEEATEEGTQTFTEYLSRRIDGTTEKTIGEALTDSLNAFVWGGFGGIVPGTIGHLTTRHARNQGVKILQDYGLSRDTAEKVFDNMADTVANVNNPQMETVRDNIRSKVAAMYEDADMTDVEREDAIDATTDLEMSWLVTEAAENGFDPEESPLLQGVVNEIGYFRTGIPEEVAQQVDKLNNEISNLRRQLKEEQAKETLDYDKVDRLESKIEQFFAKLPQDIANLVETNRQTVREMLAEQARLLSEKQSRRKMIRDVKAKAYRAMQKQDETELQKSLKRLEQESKSIEKKAREEERRQRTEQRKLRKAIEKVRQNIAKRKVGLPVADTMFEDADLVYKALKDSGFTDQQIAQMAEEDIVKTVAPYNISPITAEQFDLADENARLDDIYPAYDGETIEVDGKERTVYNSEGKRINKSAEALRNFWRWFGDSKVVDGQGRPLVVYHGTKDDFAEFQLKTGKRYDSGHLGTGFYFTNQEQSAKEYSQWKSGYGEERVLSLYLKMQNPLLLNDKDATFKVRAKKALGIPQKETQGYYSITEKESDQITNEAKKQGYDGIIAPMFSSEGEIYYVAFESTQIKSTDNRGTYSADTGNIYRQSKNRGFYIPEYRFIGRTQNMDATTLSHEFAHDWLQQFFRHYRSGNATESFMKSWGAVEKALGIPEDAITVPDKASEAFARAYEGWIQNKKDWDKNIAVDDDNRDSLIKTMERYREYLTDVYGDLTNPYFQDAWGEVGELKPELKAWFEMVTLGGDTIDTQVKMGAITPEEASVKKTAQTLNTIVEKSEDKLSTKEKQEIEAVNRMNDPSRYEVKGGNKNALQNRLSGLAQNIDANNIALGRYDTHRDMLEVARQADEFVRTRRDEALDIINGIRPETEGLYASDLYTAMERLAMETNDVELAMELVNSKVATDLAKEWGQRIAGFRNFKGNGEMDVVSQLKALDQKFKKDYDKNGKQQVEQAAQEFEQELSKADSEQDVDSFLNSLECQ